MTTHTFHRITAFLLFAPLAACGGSPDTEAVGASGQAVSAACQPTTHASTFASVEQPIAGIAGDGDVVFVGEGLSETVAVYSVATGQQIATLPPPTGGFALPFILHIVGDHKVAVLAAGGMPQPYPFVPANPYLYEYEYRYDPRLGFSATLVRDVSFASVTIGFAEDFVHLSDGRYLVTDSVIGAIWVLEPDGTIVPGIVPRSFDDADLIPLLTLCPNMPEVTVNGYPLLFSGDTIPGIEPIAERGGAVYYYSPCARGIYSFPLRVLGDNRQPYQRAAAIRLVAPTPSNIVVEELLDFQFNPHDASDTRLYAAHALAPEVIRVDTSTGRREVLASGEQLFDFPSSLTFLPPQNGQSRLLVVSNQQERWPDTNAAVTETTFNLPFIIAGVSFR
jgi:hypothetical protein